MEVTLQPRHRGKHDTDGSAIVVRLHELPELDFVPAWIGQVTANSGEVDTRRLGHR